MQQAPATPDTGRIAPRMWQAGNRAMTRLLRQAGGTATGHAVQRDGPRISVPRESPQVGVPGTPGSKRKLTDLEKQVLGAWYRANESSHAPTPMTILDISDDVQTIAGLVRQEVFKYEIGRDKVKQELAKIERFEEANSLDGSLLEVLLGLPLMVNGLPALSTAAAKTVEVLASIAIDQTVGGIQGSVSSSMAAARAASASLADSSVLTSSSFDGLLKVMDALHMANVRSNEHQGIRAINDLRVHIFARTTPIDDDPGLTQRATELLKAVSDDRVLAELTQLRATVQESLAEIRRATRDGAFSDYQRIWLIALATSPALRQTMRRRNPTGVIVKTLVDAGIAEEKWVQYPMIGTEHDAEGKPTHTYRQMELVPLVGYPEYAAEHYNTVFGVVPVK